MQVSDHLWARFATGKTDYVVTKGTFGVEQGHGGDQERIHLQSWTTVACTRTGRCSGHALDPVYEGEHTMQNLVLKEPGVGMGSIQSRSFRRVGPEQPQVQVSVRH